MAHPLGLRSEWESPHQVLDMAFSKMDPKKKQGYVEQLQKVQLAARLIFKTLNGLHVNIL